MTGKFAALLGAACLTATIAWADDYIPPVVGGHTYVQHMITLAKAAHPQIASIVVVGVRDGAKDTIVFGSTASAAQVFKPATAEDRLGGSWAAGHRHYVVREAYKSSSGHMIGTIIVTFNATRGASTARFDAIADGIATQMARATLSAKNAADPWPYDARFGPNTYAQQITERTVAKHPDLLVMMIHATPPGGGKNVIIGSNIGRFGKVADEDDGRVINAGSTNLEIGGDNDRFETELPLNDAHGKRIGALGLVFSYHDGADKDAIHAHGRAIRDEIARQIPNSAALFRHTR
ncbi:MAG: TonB-dependent siderophore receptor [Sphingomonas bacterium]|nr:TonB-dependent siderophore receptor [Sphingomonas bacterium]